MHRESVNIGIVCFVLGIAAGIILDWPVDKTGKRDAASNRRTEKRSRISKADALTLHAALDRVRQPLGNAAGDLGEDGIRAMLDELSADHNCWNSENPSHAIIGALLKEWTQRNPEAAWEWAANFSEINLREVFSAEVLCLMAHVDSEKALRLLLENHGRMSYGYAEDVVDALMTAAAKEGIESMKRIRDSLPGGISPYYSEITFPDGFDFPGLAEAMRKGDSILGYYGNLVLISNWAKADPEAAWSWWLAHPVSTGVSNNRDSAMNLVHGYAEIHGQNEALQWLVGKFVETYGEKAVWEMSDIMEEISDSPQTVTTMAKALPTAAESDDFLEKVAEYEMQQSTARMKVILEGMSSDEMRNRFLRDRLAEEHWGEEERAFLQALLKEWERKR